MKKQFKLPYVSFCDRSNEFGSIESAFKSIYLGLTAGQKRFIDKLFDDIDSCSKINDKHLAKQSMVVIICEASLIPELETDFNDDEFEKTFDLFWDASISDNNMKHFIEQKYLLYIQFIVLTSILFFNIIVIKNSIALFQYFIYKAVFLLATTLLLLIVIVVVTRHIVKE